MATDLSQFQKGLSQLPIDALGHEIERINNATLNLQRSNADLNDFAERDHLSEQEYREVIKENEDVIKRYHEKLEMVKHEIQIRCGGHNEVHDKGICLNANEENKPINDTANGIYL